MNRAPVHTCHWPGCTRAVPPRLWGCKAHWWTLPKVLRDRIWATYRSGQEISKTPSVAYIEAAQDVQRWIAETGAHAHRYARVEPEVCNGNGMYLERCVECPRERWVEVVSW